MKWVSYQEVVNMQDKYGNTALHVAAKLGKVSTHDVLLGYEDVDADITDNKGSKAQYYRDIGCGTTHHQYPGKCNPTIDES